MRALLGFLILASTWSFADTPSAPRNSLFLGAELGYLTLTPLSPELNKDGTEGSLKIYVSHSRKQWALDLGAGYTYSHLASQGIQVITRGFEAELSPKYRFAVSGNHSWMVGPVVQLLTGGDVSYDETSSNIEQNILWRAGAKIQYEFGNEWIWRAGFSGITDLNIPSRRLLGALFEIQVGLTPRPRTPSESTGIQRISLQPEFAQVKDRSIRIYLGEAHLSFPIGRDQLNSKAKEALAVLAPVLVRNVNSWKKIRIEGHTDVRNHNNQNQSLSESRANAVKKELITLKVPSKKIEAKGFGSTQPIDAAENEEAYLLNRRVEIWLDDVDPNKISQIMTELKQLQ